VPPPPKKPLFPSDLVARPTDEFLLAGRVVRSDARTFVIADAFSTSVVAGAAEVSVGDLAVVSVHPVGENLTLERVVERHRPHSPLGAEYRRFVSDGVGNHLRTRARAFDIVRSFFGARGFLEVDTPLLVPSPGLDVHLDAVQAAGGYLVTSPEYQMKRLLAGGLPRLFQVAHVFRQGEVGSRHNPEFSMLEWYRAFAGVEDVMQDTEELVSEVARSLRGTRDLDGEQGPLSVAPPFARLAVREAFERFAGVDEDRFFAMADHDADLFFRLLVERVEPALAREPKPVFLVDYPLPQASLARRKPDDPRVCERFELYVGGVELCNGFGELTDPEEQRRRFLEDQRVRGTLGKPIYPIDERLLSALEEGMPPSAGNALGLDRLVALCLGEPSIARVMPFPSGTL